jgi:hypothetical protein
MKAEPVRETVVRSMKEARKDGEHPIGLVENPAGVAFQCATCDHFDDGVCRHHDPRLDGKKVEGAWCCNEFEHPGMRTVIA